MFLLLFHVSVLLPTSVVASQLPSENPSCSNPKSTTNGLLIGHAASKQPNVCEYLGVPYALPPTDHLRFAPPKSFTSNTTHIASSYSPDCPQPSPRQVIYPNATAQELRIIANFANQANNHTQSEDCLTLNIWSKNTERKNKPTLIFLHGGRWTGGTSNTPYYDGQLLAHAEDVIVVTLNFRINIFGFPGAPGYPQNIALLDQRRAVEWIRDNIAAFGGSSAKLVLVGQSSGGVAVDMWSYAYRLDPIVSGIASHSGNVFSFPVNNLSLSAANWYNVSGQIGCGTSGDVMPCMRSVPFTAIRAAAALVRPQPSDSIARSIPVFQPTVDNVTVFEDYKTLSYHGLFAPMPYLQGTNDYESGYYKITAYGSTNATAPESVWSDFQLGSFTCPTAVQANNRARFGVPTYRYRYFGDWKNLRLYPGSGAYHGAEMHMIIGNSDEVSGLPPSEVQKQLTKVMMSAWAAFADDPASGLLKKLGWPKYEAHKMTEATLVRLGYKNSPVPDSVNPHQYDRPCDLLHLPFLYTVQ